MMTGKNQTFLQLKIIFLLNNSYIEYISRYAFEGCQFQEIIFTPTVTTLELKSFALITTKIIDLSKTNIQNLTQTSFNSIEIERVILPSKLIILSGSFFNCSKLTGELIIPESVETIGSDIFLTLTAFCLPAFFGVQSDIKWEGSGNAFQRRKFLEKSEFFCLSGKSCEVRTRNPEI